MEIGAITKYIDVAQLVLYAFWIFFGLLILYLLRENKREGYPLESDRQGGVTVVGFPRPPSPKTFHLANGAMSTVPRVERASGPMAAVPAAAWPGAPMVPTGDPMVDAVGPATYAMREDVPEMTHHGEPKIVPLRADPEFKVAPEGTNPLGMTIVDLQGKVAGTVADLWVDKPEQYFRYLEAEAAEGGARVLIPMTLVRVDDKTRTVILRSIAAKQLANAPKTKNPDTVTLLEEDRISAYFASGHLYAYPGRTESWL